MRLVAHVCLIVLGLVAAVAPTSAQAPATDSFLSGYARDLRGEVGRHASPHPGIFSALIARAADPATHDIAWETIATPETAGGPIEFALIIGLSATPDGQSPSRWDLYVGDAKVQTIESAPRGALAGKVEGRTVSITTARVEWTLFWVDRNGDQFGHLYVTVPSGLYSPGHPVRMRIVAAPGRDATSRDAWLMVFRAEARTRVTVGAEPSLLRGVDGQPEQQMRVEIAHFGAMEGASVSIAIAGQGTPTAPTENAFAIDDGYVTLRVPMPMVSAAATAAVIVRIANRVVFDGTVAVQPVKPVSIYLLHHSHLDIGYTHVQRDVAMMQARNLEQALALIEKSRDYPSDAQFKWNVEGFWAVEAFLAKATPEQRDQLLAAMRAGRVEIGPLYGNMLTGLAQPEELTRMTEAARRFAREAGVPMTTAWISDVPGYSWGVVPALARSGIKYFSLGTNTGDRIGHIIERLGDRPFYWRSASGQERLLCWLHASGYSYFHTGLSYTHRANLLAEEKLFGYVRQLQAPDRPSFDVLPLRYNIGSDNGPPDDRLSDLVRAWNEKYVSPHLVVATMSEFFSAFEQRYGASLPEYAGDLTPYWEDGAYSTARETITNQASAARLEQAETFWALRAPGAFPADRFREAWRNVLLFNEHTWGSWNSISAPENPFTQAQWETKRAFATEADRQSRALLDDALGSEAAPAPEAIVTSVDVFNSLSWPRTDLVIVPAAWHRTGDGVIDVRGRRVRSQRLANGDLAFLAMDVPALGTTRFRLVASPSVAGDAIWTGGDDGKAYIGTGTRGLSVDVDPATGAIREISGIVGGAVDSGLNQYVYQAGREPGGDHMQTPMHVRITKGDNGPLVGTLVIESSSVPGATQLRQELRIVAGVPRVDIVNTIDKRNINDPEAVYFAFPFDMDNVKTRLGLVHGFYRPEVEQLSGSCKNYFTVRNWLDVSNADRGMTLVTPDALLVELGRVTTDANRVGWIERASESSIVYSYVMNNFWGTNYKAGQDGVTTYRYRLVPHARFDAASAYKAGLEGTYPLVVRLATNRLPRRAPFRLVSRRVIVSEMRPSDDGRRMLVTLFNAGEQPERPVLVWKKSHQRVTRVPRLPPFGLATLTLK